MTKKKTVLLIISLMMLCLLLSGCGKKEPIADKKGETLSLTYEDIQKEGREGFFVLNKDNTFSPVIDSFQGYSGEVKTPKEISPSRYLWFTDNNVKISKLIPVVTKNTPLVAIYNTNESMPEEYTLERYKYKGYTIGSHIMRNEDNSLSLITADCLPGTNAEKVLSSFIDEDMYTIDTINGNKALPVNNVDNNMTFILGLQKDKLYRFTFYKGTQYNEISVTADAQVFQSDSFISLQNPYKTTKKGYFKITLPENLKPGYYYICGLGMFKYQG